MNLRCCDVSCTRSDGVLYVTLRNRRPSELCSSFGIKKERRRFVNWMCFRPQVKEWVGICWAGSDRETASSVTASTSRLDADNSGTEVVIFGSCWLPDCLVFWFILSIYSSFPTLLRLPVLSRFSPSGVRRYIILFHHYFHFPFALYFRFSSILPLPATTSLFS
jgi:hypothetical protein